MTVVADAFSARRPAYITRIVSAIWYSTDMSCVTTTTDRTNSRSRNSTSVRATACWLVTSSAEVTSSPISSDGSSSVDSTSTTRCFMPPDSSIGYRASTLLVEPDEAQAALQLGRHGRSSHAP